jgi:hypothetical protein
MNKFYILIFLLISTSTTSRSQSNSDPYANRVIAKHYTNAELLNMETNFPQRFKYVKYYYIHSFYITPYSCGTCQSYVPELVDVSAYESYRQQSSRVTINNTINGFNITLFSKDELSTMIKTGIPINPAPASSPRAAMTGPVPVDFPLLEETGNLNNDMNAYLQAFNAWITQNPDAYHEMTRIDSGIHFISAAEFMTMPVQKQQQIIQNQGTYVIRNN